MAGQHIIAYLVTIFSPVCRRPSREALHPATHQYRRDEQQHDFTVELHTLLSYTRILPRTSWYLSTSRRCLDRQGPPTALIIYVDSGSLGVAVMHGAGDRGTVTREFCSFKQRAVGAYHNSGRGYTLP